MRRFFLTLAITLAGFGLATAQDARQILDASGVQGGLVVHVGCGDGALTAALHAADSYTVQGLDANPQNVEAARKTIRAAGVYGAVSASRFDGTRLPYADNLVNLVVARDSSGVPMDEIMRVLVPNGVACIIKNGAIEKKIKPRPGDIDEWTHFLHDAGNNAVAHDTKVDLPRALQWVAPPLWLRSHETPSGFEALVNGGGRVFYIFDEGLIGITDQRLPERWALICRDAFNGRLLWRQPLGKWGWPEWAKSKFEGQDWTTIGGGRTAVPEENQRRLVADGNRLYATLAYDAPLSILDAATGKTLKTIEGTAPARQFLSADGVVVVYTAPLKQMDTAKAGKAAQRKSREERRADAAKNRKNRKAKTSTPSTPATPATPSTESTSPEPAGTLVGIQGETGQVLWRRPAGAIQGLSLAIDGGRVIFLADKKLNALDLRTGNPVWQVDPAETSLRTLVAVQGMVVLLGNTGLEVRDAATGAPAWHKTTELSAAGLGGEDLFVVNGTIWPRVRNVDENKAAGQKWKGSNALAVGYDLKTGAEAKTIFVPDLLSPEHHHRCYRNKATDRFIIMAMEGSEFIDLQADGHGQNNFVRGACRLGIMPCNGMLYAPPDQCFCEPGGKLLGFTALCPAPARPLPPVPDDQRLQRGPAYDSIRNPQSAIGNSDWPTFRHDAARHGATPAGVGAAPADAWTVKLGGGLTAPVAVGGRIYIASRDTHTLHALDAASGKEAWSFVAGGRIDSPPTLDGGRVLLGSADGCVYCLRAEDGALAWRFLAAPSEKLIASFDQFESAWPVHGSVLLRDGVAYVTAGRSTYLDGGIKLWGLDPATGRVVHQGNLYGPQPDLKNEPRDLAFWIRGANSDVLVSEGDAIYMRQKRITPALQEQPVPPLSSKGESDVGLHVFSTSGLLDGSWYNRAFWMYSKRWPGFQLANQAPKSGQLLVVDDRNTYSVGVFYRRNVHTTMFFPAREGYLLFADKNTNEPQIVGDKDARKPVAWLPQSEYTASSGLRTLDSEAFGLDKMIGYTRAEPTLWQVWLPVRVRAMVKAGDTIFAAGPPDVLDPADPYAAFEGRKGTKLVSVSAADGKKVNERELPADPVFDGMIAAGGRLIAALEDGSVVCMK